MNDHIIKGRMDTDHRRCANCGKKSLVTVRIDEVNLPDGIKDGPSLITHGLDQIGITCGCYARFHRQVAHITDNMKARDDGKA